MHHRLANIAQSLLLLCGMVLLLSYLSQAIFGVQLDLWLLLLVMLVALSISNSQPLLTMRLYRAQPINYAQAPDVYEALDRLARRAGLTRTPRLYLIGSATRNAFTTGNRQEAVIAVTTGLLNSLSFRELIGVLAHELSHLKNHDLLIMNLADLMARLTTAFAFIGSLLLAINIPLFLLGHAYVNWLAVLLMMLSPLLSALLQMALSRSREFDADACAADLTGDPLALASALNRIDPERIGFLSRWGIRVERQSNPSLLRSHPDSSERIRRLVNMAEANPSTPTKGQPPQLGSLSGRTQPPRRYWSGVWY